MARDSAVAMAALGLAAVVGIFLLTRKNNKVRENPSTSPLLPCSDEFKNAAERSKQLSISDTKVQLRLYGLYKRATSGRADSTAQPWEPTRRAMWGAWNDCRDLSKEEAEMMYVALVKDLSSTPLIEVKKVTMGPKVSKMVVDTEENTASGLGSKVSEQYMKVKNDFSLLLETLETVSSILHETDEDGRTLLHWAVDEDNLDAVMALVEKGALIDAMDDDGFTPLGYACLSDLEEIAVFLVEAGADTEKACSTETAVQLTKSASLKDFFKSRACQRQL